MLWSSEEFGFCEVPDAWASGSSIMPQKKNPDAAELLRAKAPRIVAHLCALHGVMPGSAHLQQGLQEDKEHLFDAADTLELCLARAGMLAGDFDRERLAERGDRRADRRDRRRRPARPQGRPVPPVHGIVAGLVREARSTGRRPLSDLSEEELREHSPALDDDYDVLAERSWLESKVSEGGTASSACASSSSAARARVARPPAATRSSTTGPVVEVARDLVGCMVATTAPPA